MNFVSQVRVITKEKDLSVGETANILTIVAITEICTRNLHGFLADSKFMRKTFLFPRKVLFSITLVMSAVCYSLMPFMHDFLSTAIMIAFSSIFNSGSVIHSPLVFMDTHPHAFSSAFGLSNIFKAAFALLMGPILGKLQEASGSIDMALYFISSALWAMMLFGTVVDIFLGRFLRNDKGPE